MRQVSESTGNHSSGNHRPDGSCRSLRPCLTLTGMMTSSNAARRTSGNGFPAAAAAAAAGELAAAAARGAAIVSLPGCGRVRRFRLDLASARGSARGRARERRQSPSAVVVLQVVVVAPLVAGLQVVVVVEKPPSNLPGTRHRSWSPGAHPCALQHHWKKRPWKARDAHCRQGALKQHCHEPVWWPLLASTA